MGTVDVLQVALAVIGIPLWIWAFIHAVGHSDADFQLAGLAPRLFWLVTIVLLGPVWGVAYLWYGRPRLNKARVPQAS
jgi:hypothetical protein